MFLRTLSILLLFAAAVSVTEITNTANLAITIYNDDFAIVKDTRLIHFEKGLSDLYFDDVAATIQTQTVSLTPDNKTNSKISIYEQNFENNLADKHALLKNYIGKQVELEVAIGQTTKSIKGELLAYAPNYLVRLDSGAVSVLQEAQIITVAALPQNMLLKPTLKWKVHTKEETTVECQVAYRATGFSWKSDYILTINEQENVGSFVGWVTIDNNSGKEYKDTRLKLIAGEVNTVRQYNNSYPMPMMMAKAVVADYASGAPQSFSEKAFSDYHMYTLPRTVTVEEKSSKQIEFIPSVPQLKLSKYNLVKINAGGYEENDIPVHNVIKIRNSEEAGLGLPLPKGTVRVFKRDVDDDSLQFIGEDSIKHTPRNQNFTLSIGKAFDVTAKKIVMKRKDYQNGYDATMKLVINNRALKHRDIRVEMNNYNGDNLQIKSANLQGTPGLNKIHASRYVLETKIEAEKTIEFTWEETYRHN